MRNPEHIARRRRGDERETRVDAAIDEATAALLDAQRPDGHWVFELEADSTISSEYITLMHFLGERDAQLEARIARYLRRRQGAYGGWPLTRIAPNRATGPGRGIPTSRPRARCVRSGRSRPTTTPRS